MYKLCLSQNEQTVFMFTEWTTCKIVAEDTNCNIVAQCTHIVTECANF